jgi:WS/DGAT/MGAT family acyltransferase
MTQLAAEASGARMQFAAIALLDDAPTIGDVRVLLASRIDTVPRLRQRLVRVRRGRPIWLGDPTFDLSDHVESMMCPPPGDRPALLAVTARIVEERLSLARPPWRVVLVDGLDPGSAGGRSALVIVLHHVLADGVAGLAVLGRLTDAPGPVARSPVTPLAGPADRRPTGPRRWIDGAARLRAGALELLRDGTRGAPACSINAGPVGPRRALGTARAELAPLVAAAKDAGGTVNDVALTAVTGALRDLLAGRGERPGRLVVSVPITARRRAEIAELGNQGGVLPVCLPLAGRPRDRLRAVAGITRARKTDRPGASAAWYGPFARALAGMGAFGWFIGHQRLVNTFVTNVRGPAEPQTFDGRRIVELIPVSPISGNVGVGFAVLSYAGRLSITVVADADRCPDVDRLAALVQAQLDELAAAPARMAGTARPSGTKSPSTPAGAGERRRPDPAPR